MTFSKMTLSKTTLILATLNSMKISIKTLSRTKLIIMTFSIVALNIITLTKMTKRKEIWHFDS